MDVHAYLLRLVDELFADVVSQHRMAVSARACLEGSVRALQAAGHLDHQDGTGMLAMFDQRLHGAGLVEDVVVTHLSHAAAAASANDDDALWAKPVAPPPAGLEAVVPVGLKVAVPAEGIELVLLHLTRWTTGADLGWAVVGPEEALRAFRMSARDMRASMALFPWRLDVWDDVGTRYRIEASSGGGGGQRQRAEVRLGPRIPDEANTLTVVFREDGGAEIARVDIAVATL